MAIHVGTSGYSYQDWRGHFYPEGLPEREMLAFYSRHFETVEINTTYYRMPDAGMLSRMRQKVPPEFRFVVKAGKELTHEIGGEADALFARFVSALAPLRDAGQLGCVLAQFPWSFRNSAPNRAYVAALADRMQGTATVVEFRNREWVRDETFDLLRAAGLGYCCVDEPRLKGLMPPLAVATSSVGYFRFHGRNAQKWWRHEEAWERYDYLYSETELREWVPRIHDVARQTQETYAFFNNHYQGQAGRNARMLMQLLLPEQS
ncbi:MAG: DUF72 domain-containing protein [Armatimonadetes bacterium]|nr:DUF72 domain-containing protein [Armatimonadota bacterium]